MMLLERRRGSLLATSVAMVAIFLTVTVGAMAFFENSVRQARADRWRYLASDAARSGLDFVLGWAEANIDAATKLPRDWEMNDGDVIDPVRGFMDSAQGTSAPKVGTDFGSVPRPTFGVGVAAAANPAGSIVSNAQNSEFVLGRYNDYVLSFKARVQQFRMSDDQPRQYKIGVVGRVRRVPTPGYSIANESRGIVAERTLIATVGKEPFSKYATLIDIDLVKNWVPGEVVDGPVHINRGYADANPGVVGYTMADSRSKMVLHAPGIFNTITAGIYYPIFRDAVTMTWDSTAPVNPDTDSDYRNTIMMKTAAGDQLAGTTAFKNESSKIFLAPENQAVLGGGAGPKLVPDNLDMPRSSRARLASALGVPTGRNVTDYPWFSANVSNTTSTYLPDGLYLPTFSAMATPTATIPAYQATDTPAGCIYIRGNVEIMRMVANDQYSYYIFQLGYGTAAGARRTYVVRTNRQTCEVKLRAWPQGSLIETQLVNAGTTGQNLDTYVDDPSATNQTDPRQYAVGATGNIYHRFFNPASTNPFPFNGIIFVDLSTFDPARICDNATPANKERYYGLAIDPQKVPISGNILALGDPGQPSNPQLKRGFPQTATDTHPTAELIDTRTRFSGAALTPTSPASKLSIVAAGNIFIQNHLLLRSLSGTDRTNPTTDSVTLSKSRDLLGIVADKQVVAGLCAPSTTTRTNVGTCVHAAIAALGDPAFGWNAATSTYAIDPNEIKGIAAYRGSFATEGLMQAFPTPIDEKYNLVSVTLSPGQALPAPGGTYKFNINAGPNDIYPGEALGPTRYPMNPLYKAYGYPFASGTPTNPNVTDTRGRLLVFGSVTQKKRGIVGVGNRSFDKDFRFDKRLLSIAPPMFPTSTNMVLKVSQPVAVDKARMPYTDINPTPADPTYQFLGRP